MNGYWAFGPHSCLCQPSSMSPVIICLKDKQKKESYICHWLGDFLKHVSNFASVVVGNDWSVSVGISHFHRGMNEWRERGQKHEPQWKRQVHYYLCSKSSNLWVAFFAPRSAVCLVCQEGGRGREQSEERAPNGQHFCAARTSGWVRECAVVHFSSHTSISRHFVK